MSKTIKEVADSVLKKLGRLPDGQVAPASQQKTITDDYDDLYNELFNDSLINWAYSDDIPSFAVMPIKILLLGRNADDFGVPDTWSVREKQQRKKLASQITTPYEAEPTPFRNY